MSKSFLKGQNMLKVVNAHFDIGIDFSVMVDSKEPKEKINEFLTSLLEEHILCDYSTNKQTIKTMKKSEKEIVHDYFKGSIKLSELTEEAESKIQNNEYVDKVLKRR